jgi:hypothetical protein
MKLSPNQTDRWLVTEAARFRRKIEPYLASYLANHDDGDAAAISKAFVATHPELLTEFVELIITGLVSQRELPF